ncbi:type I-F CRISPR-associated endoribonuclease Cas6/Csy4 [Marinibactrum halimedae]|uniref:Type I-F CRISPR-associated endoribonuclease Cas6/Csy4 n=1 Tax=Marinibactrum halimedae TaxID=1444977 RepID=A0AA37T6X8_9GAMM|nr:type I-F CRISPR-associated endoribonuclease Cas6/Csy4 [Marinibactrum halimedae]MCD9460209.1 type I-F CRISPR-associated endoribonuclease Cas6/Csy4 [Marinibactrum halimedae]GLS27959.1 type I-F CRISPR-associated endoribonuclease Cas6/Csy4 [Marinibactrum halimedae]
MDYYTDITLIPDPDFLPPMLMSALFNKFHRGLVSQGLGKIGVSFPKLKTHLGEVLRLHGTVEALDGFMAQPWLTGMRDHCRVGEILPVPDSCEYVTVSRVQSKSNVDRLRRRAQKRHGYTEQEAQERIPDGVEEALSLPFVRVSSQSTGQRFCLFIQQTISQQKSESGKFSAYGLSSSTTVPWF